jgi:AcrR family transcriptional regulator
MKPERLTHARRKEQTRARLLDAARSIFLEKGLAATSVEDIVEAAGYTRGAFYSNFRSKQELLTELLRRDADEARANLQAIFEEGGTPEERKARAIAYFSSDYPESDCFPLWVEAQLLACRDSLFGERVRAFRREKLSQLSAYIRMLLVDSDSALPLQVDALALGLMSLCDGMQFLGMCDPQTVTDQTMHSVLAQSVSCLLWRQPENKRRREHPDSATASCI